MFLLTILPNHSTVKYVHFPLSVKVCSKVSVGRNGLCFPKEGKFMDGGQYNGKVAKGPRQPWSSIFIKLFFDRYKRV